MQRGTLTGGPPFTGIGGTPAREMDYTLGPTGNWSAYLTKTSGTTDLTQARSHNPVNEITAITSSPSWSTPPAYDAAGNMTSFPQPASPGSAYTATYDAWNRLVSVSDGSSTVAKYQYDGSNRRTVKQTYSGGTLSETRHFYYTSDWQDIEERTGSSTSMDKQYVWGVWYVDELVCRDDATPQRLYAMQDADFNLTCVCDTSGSVKERYLFDPYGTRTIMNASWSVIGSSAYSWVIGHQELIEDIESELIYVRNRYLQSDVGMFGSRDPIGTFSSKSSLYWALNDNPIMSNDPSGLETTTQLTPCPANSCGPDITNNLIAISIDVQNQWNNLSLFQKTRLVADTLTPPFALQAWDIANLVQANVSNGYCKNGIGNCIGTVTVNSKCYKDIAVNYWFAGLIYNAFNSSWLECHSDIT